MHIPFILFLFGVKLYVVTKISFRERAEMAMGIFSRKSPVTLEQARLQVIQMIRTPDLSQYIMRHFAENSDEVK